MQGIGLSLAGAYVVKTVMKYSLQDQHVVMNGECYIAPSASVIGSVVLGNNVSIWFNSVVRGDNDTITIGEGSQVQDGCVLHTDPGFPVDIGSNVSIGHLAMIHGCTIGDGALIGINSIVLNGVKIGKNTLIGANSLITEDKVIPDGVLVMGSPGKVIRELSNEEIQGMLQNAHRYVMKMKHYRSHLQQQP